MPFFSVEGDKLQAILSGKAEVRFFCVSPELGYFHFWNKSVYSEPQFGDLFHAKGYKTKSTAMARRRALNNPSIGGYSVVVLKQLVFLEKP